MKKKFDLPPLLEKKKLHYLWESLNHENLIGEVCGIQLWDMPGLCWFLEDAWYSGALGFPQLTRACNSRLQKYRRLLKYLYDNIISTIHLHEKTNPIKINRGTRQGENWIGKTKESELPNANRARQGKLKNLNKRCIRERQTDHRN